jgi:hypothetical protein
LNSNRANRADDPAVDAHARTAARHNPAPGVTAHADERNVIDTLWGDDWLNLADNIETNVANGMTEEPAQNSATSTML